MITHKNTNIVGDIYIWSMVLFNVQSVLWICYKNGNEGTRAKTLFFYGTVTATSVQSDSLMGDLGSMSGGFCY